MAAFNYTGMAKIVWSADKTTVQFIHCITDTGKLSVWPEDETIEKAEYIGYVQDHPALNIIFLHK